MTEDGVGGVEAEGLEVLDQNILLALVIFEDRT